MSDTKRRNIRQEVGLLSSFIFRSGGDFVLTNVHSKKINAPRNIVIRHRKKKKKGPQLLTMKWFKKKGQDKILMVWPGGAGMLGKRPKDAAPRRDGKKDTEESEA